ncbi:MAG: VOC family protein [Planctomycetes bacterium]|nr:VOC family protein [Planctomycetota bacterium]
MLLARYIFFTADVPRMVAFYRDVLGLTVLDPPKAMDYDKSDWVQLASGGVEIGIHRAGKAGSAGHNRNKLVFIVKDVAAARERLSGLGVRMGKHHVSSEFECCDFADPDGNVLQLSSR